MPPPDVRNEAHSKGPSSTDQPNAAAAHTRSLHASEQLFRLLVNSVRDYSIFVIDRDGKILTWNPGAEKIKGYRESEIVGQPYEVFFTHTDRVSGKPAFILAQAVARGSFHDEGWRVRKDGSTFWASATITRLLDEHGALRGFAKVTHDDTERHNASENLRRSEERFRLAISALREHAFYMLDPTGLVESWNPGAERHKGYTGAEIIGQHFEVFFTDDDRVSGKPMRELAVAKQMGSFEEEGWRVRKDGSRFWASVVITPVYDDQGLLRSFVKVTRDETVKHAASVHLQQALERARSAETASRQHATDLEQRVIERTEMLSKQTDKLARTNAELEQFAFIASHDLKEPLRMITSYLDLLRSRYGDRFDERATMYVTRVVSAADRMRELVEAVLEYSRSGGGLESFDVIPINEVVDVAIANQGSAAQETGIRIDVGQLPTIRANRLHLIRVFQNLITNALKFKGSTPPVIRITATESAHAWTFSVADNGIGIDEQMHPRLFKIFQRLHGVDEYPGSGIGLATCKKIVEQHGGRIWVTSTPGAGSDFQFTIPKQA